MEESGWQKGIISTVLLLGPFVFSFAFALDIYIPSVPMLKTVFHTSAFCMQLTLSLFLFFLAVGQLAFGPLSDRWGRKSVALYSALMFALGSLWAVCAFNVGSLIGARILQAVGASGMMVSSFAIVRDAFSGNQSAKVFSYLNAMISISPLLAPVAGGYIAHSLGWRYSFGLLALIGGLAVLLVFFYFRESLVVEHRQPFNLSIFARYLEVVKNRQFIMYALCTGFGNAAFFCFFSSSPYVLIKLLHIPMQHFGYYFGMLGLVYMLGSLLSGKLVAHIAVNKMVLIGAVLLLVSGFLMLGWYEIRGLSALGFILPIAFTGIGGSFMMGAGVSGALEPFGHIAGVASALAGCLQFAISSIVGTILMHWPVVSTQPLSICFIVLGLCSILAVLMVSKRD